MSKPYESILATARKLAAIAEPSNNAAPAEIEAASKALAALIERYDLKPEDLDESRRVWQALICKSRFKDQPPRIDKNLAMLARVIFAYIVGDMGRRVRIYKTEIELPMRGLAVKMKSVLACEAECTDLEYNEWRDCFEHYAPAFIEANDELRREASLAASAYKFAWSNFAVDNDITPPMPESPPPTLKESLRNFGMKKPPIIAPWQRGPKLANSNLLA